MLGDIDTNGSLNAQIIHQLTDRIRGKMVVQVRTFVSYTGNPPYGKKEGSSTFSHNIMRTLHGPKFKESQYFCIIFPCANDIVYAWFEDVKSN